MSTPEVEPQFAASEESLRHTSVSSHYQIPDSGRDWFDDEGEEELLRLHETANGPLQVNSDPKAVVGESHIHVEKPISSEDERAEDLVVPRGGRIRKALGFIGRKLFGGNNRLEYGVPMGEITQDTDSGSEADQTERNKEDTAQLPLSTEALSHRQKVENIGAALETLIENGADIDVVNVQAEIFAATEHTDGNVAAAFHEVAEAHGVKRELIDDALAIFTIEKGNKQDIVLPSESLSSEQREQGINAALEVLLENGVTSNLVRLQSEVYENIDQDSSHADSALRTVLESHAPNEAVVESALKAYYSLTDTKE